MLIYFLLDADISNEAEETRVYYALLESIKPYVSVMHRRGYVTNSLREVRDGFRLNISYRTTSDSEIEDAIKKIISTTLKVVVKHINENKAIREGECLMFMYPINDFEEEIASECIAQNIESGKKLCLVTDEELEAFLVITLTSRAGVKLDPNFVAAVLDDVEFVEKQFGEENEEGDIEVTYVYDQDNLTVNILVPPSSKIDNDLAIFVQLVRVIPPALECMLQKIELILVEGMVDYEGVLMSYVFPESVDQPG